MQRLQLRRSGQTGSDGGGTNETEVVGEGERIVGVVVMEKEREEVVMCVCPLVVNFLRPSSTARPSHPRSSASHRLIVNEFQSILD